MTTYNSQQLTKLKGYYRSFLAQREILDEEARDGLKVANSGSFQFLQREVMACQYEFPDLLPVFVESDFFSKSEDPTKPVFLHMRLFDTNALRRYVGATCGRIAAALEQEDTGSIIETLEFKFLQDPGIRSIVVRDYEEAQRDYVSRSWKSVILLCGGLIEALLLDALSREREKALASKAAPKGKDLDKWVLSDLLAVAEELEIVEPIVKTLGHTVRQYRNLIHPGSELRNKLRIERLEADNALNVLKTIERDLTVHFSAG